MRTIHIILVIALIAIGLGPSVHPALAQGDEDTNTCTQMVQQVLTDLGTNCADIGPNSACYANKQVSRMFMDETIEDDIFTEPGDQIDLTSLATISTSPFNLEEKEWGLTVVSTRANIHNALDDEVTYILFGDVEVESRVQPEDALQPVEPITATTITNVDVYREPDATSELLGTVLEGAEVQVDAVSPDGDWGRILYNDEVLNYAAWIQNVALDASVDLDGLPVIDEDNFAPMQDILLRNGYDAPECSEAIAPMMLIQAPENTQVDLRINGIDMRLESSVLLRILTPGDRIEAITLDGLLYLFPGRDRQVIVPPGHRSVGCLSRPGNYGGLDGIDNDRINSCPFGPPDPLTEANLQILVFLNLLPINILHYRIIIPIVITGSGIGTVIITIILPPLSLAPACRLCNQGNLPDNICQRFRCPTP
ncbi:MAG TPA: SH3 domain-containing protein [Aggregatilinea sp.]|uniref:SH3 domain-containing protein n=1 Tax=Aggregatilinea sp. TaxID=2806333 RepID=UPI002C9CCC52|nr:SH3 domain-containing protein [Aggregatilinea sp.]HML21592.1 SH3 domain-containing protein [Aggregatilinea sp.]